MRTTTMVTPTNIIYLQVSNNDNDNDSPISPTPSSPPPSFRSRASSPTSRRLLHDTEPVDQNLADTFDADGSDDEDNDGDDRQRLMRGNPASSSAEHVASVIASDGTTTLPTVRRPTILPTFTPTSTRVYGGGSGSDGVFANLSAKPESGEKVEEHLPVG